MPLRILTLILFTLIGYSLSDDSKCLARNQNLMQISQKTDCTNESDSTTRCCYTTYSMIGFNIKICTPVSKDLSSNLDELKKQAQQIFDNYMIECDHYFFKFSFIIFGIFTFLF